MSSLLQKRAIEKEAKKVAYKFCTEDCFSQYDNCPHKTELINKPFPLLGKGDICPVEKYKILFTNKKHDLFEALANSATLIDCAYMCANCEHAEVNQKEWNSGYLSTNVTDEDFENYCLNCPVTSVRECIEECIAEAES